jgi:hypothetical protein
MVGGETGKETKGLQFARYGAGVCELNMTKELEWGETPWDDLTREELLKEVWKMFSALQSANSVLQRAVDARFLPFVDLSDGDFSRAQREVVQLAANDLYWGQGTGGAAIDKVNQALSRANKYSSENLYRSFFRYADDLLFKRTTKRIGWGWVVCSKCGQMVGETRDGKSDLGKPCKYGEKDCKGTYRRLKWSDLSPKKT